MPPKRGSKRAPADGDAPAPSPAKKAVKTAPEQPVPAEAAPAPKKTTGRGKSAVVAASGKSVASEAETPKIKPFSGGPDVHIVSNKVKECSDSLGR
jgi:hypothetical protein